jgi:hypothetical protein
MRQVLLALSLAGPLCATPLFAQGAASESSFLQSLEAGRLALPIKAFARDVEDRRIAQQLSAYLDWYDLMERQPAIDVPAMTATIAAGLRSGAYTSLILGESHGVDAEERASQQLVGGALDSGVPVGAFLREENLYPNTQALEARHIPVLTYKNQFKPEDDVKAGLKAAGKGLLISYSGCAHTADRIKDFFLYTLEEGKTWHYEKGKHDMPTIEQSFLSHRKKPLIVAMSAEETILSKVQSLFLKGLVGNGTDLDHLKGDFDALLSAWGQQMTAYALRTEPIIFARSPEQPNLYAGLTPSDRRAFEIEAARKILGLPELAAWLGADKIKSVESLKAGSFTPPSTREWHYDVIVHSASKGDFKRTIPEEELRK